MDAYNRYYPSDYQYSSYGLPGGMGSRRPPTQPPPYPSYQVPNMIQGPYVEEVIVERPLNKTLSKPASKKGVGELDIFWLVSEPVNIIPVASIFTLFILFYFLDTETYDIEDEVPDPDDTPNTSPGEHGIKDDPDVSDMYVPNGPLEITVPSLHDNGSNNDGPVSDNKTISVDSVTGRIKYTIGALSTQMIWDWITGVAHRAIPPATSAQKIRNRNDMMKITHKDAVALLHDMAITDHADLWALISAPCSSTKRTFISPQECAETRDGLRILAWRFFSVKRAPFAYPVRTLRLKIRDASEWVLLGGEEDEDDSRYTTTRYYLGATNYIESLNPALLGQEIK